MNTQQAYIRGFVKRASQHGFTYQEALGILKQAMPPELKELNAFQKETPTHTWSHPIITNTLRNGAGTGNWQDDPPLTPDQSGYLRAESIRQYGTPYPSEKGIASEKEFNNYLENKNSGGNQPAAPAGSPQGNTDRMSRYPQPSTAPAPAPAPALTSSPGGFFGPNR